MKNTFFSLSITFTITFFFIGIWTPVVEAQTSLGPGDMGITLMNMEDNNSDAFGIVLFKDVEAGTVFRITDKSYNEGAGFGLVAEGILTVTFELSYLCGTEIIFTDHNEDPAIYDFQADLNGITTVPDNDFQLSTAGETLIVYQSEDPFNPPDDGFITAVANTGAGFGESGTGTSDLPPGLVLGNSAMEMTPNPSGNEWDNIKYDCSITQKEDLNALRDSLYNPDNWFGDDEGPFPTVKCSPFFSCMDPCDFPTVTLTITPSEFCLNQGVQTGLSGGEPVGGIYTGVGVTDDGNGTTFMFDPEAVGVGMSSVRYTYTTTDGCSNTSQKVLTVNAVPVVSEFTVPDTVSVNGAVSTELGFATPSGGIYSGPGVMDDGNGMTYQFNPKMAGPGDHLITYAFTDSLGCTGAESLGVHVFQLPISDMGDISGIDTDGLAINEGALVAVQGVVHCGDFSEGEALEFWIMEPDGDGIYVVGDAESIGYEVTEGDALYVEGTLFTLNGLLGILPNYMEVITQDNDLNTPEEVTVLGEDNQSKWVTLADIVMPEEATVTDQQGDYVFTVMTLDMQPIEIVYKASTGVMLEELEALVESAKESFGLKLTGIATQNDPTLPYLSGYQLWPCNLDNFELIVSDNLLGSEPQLLIYPNPTQSQVEIATQIPLESYHLLDIHGKVQQKGLLREGNNNISLEDQASGLYLLQLKSEDQIFTRRLVIYD